jgi:hypothetical protein
MIRFPTLSFAAGLALLATASGLADETFPVVHSDPIAVRILGCKDGKPVAHARLTLFAGYDQQDLRDRLWREETVSDNQGRARFSSEMENLPFVQVWVANKHLCFRKTAASSFSVELIRRDGLSAPNRCGFATVEDAPGILTVFVKARAKKVKLVKVKSPSPCRAWWHRWRTAPASPAPAQTPAPAASIQPSPPARSALPAEVEPAP